MRLALGLPIFLLLVAALLITRRVLRLPQFESLVLFGVCWRFRRAKWRDWWRFFDWMWTKTRSGKRITVGFIARFPIQSFTMLVRFQTPYIVRRIRCG